MQKVKVTRYVSGRRPEYAQSETDSDSSDEEEGFAPVGGAEEEEEGLGEGLVEEQEGGMEVAPSQDIGEDRRLRRLRDIQLSGTKGRYVTQCQNHMLVKLV